MSRTSSVRKASAQSPAFTGLRLVIAEMQISPQSRTHARSTKDTMKKRSQRRKHCALANAEPYFRPAADPFPGGAGRPKVSQLETVTTLTYKLMQFGEDRCNFDLSW